MERILLTNPPEMLRNFYGDRALAALRAQGDVRENPLGRELTTPELIEAARGCAVIVSHRGVVADRALFDGLPELIAFCRCAVDIRNVAVAAASANGVLVTHASPGFVASVAELVLGTMIGAERQYRQRTAGLRTNVLVTVGAAAFVDLAMHLTAADGAVRVISYVVSGIGFLGAGVIMKEGMNVRGLNTAATLWGSAAVGCCAGADMIAQAVALTAFVLAGNTLLRPLVNAINRSPLDEQSSEATYYLKLAVMPDVLAEMRDQLVERLEAAQYPVADVDVVEHGDGLLEIVATLVSTAIDPGELDVVVSDLQRQHGVRHVTWEVSTKD